MLVLMTDKLAEKENDGDRVEKTEKAEVVEDKASSDKARRTERKLSVRDLAIQPTQRVMRYVLLYQGKSVAFPCQTSLTDYISKTFWHIPHNGHLHVP